ncbi:hypothetical protein [Streptomyces sp. ME19-01-6]|uniref:hypothetical protein n=1 Tax=Streptomyces sp. ME19-01-6 TaxID=3028686 RepID=UPI0029BF3CEF|nr:hypothetical protein [Streptomyces sp. ME19-01-6]MDX3229160.1 hypothetical protein [Streptomyces sp. ME19-01-6]
MDYSEKVDEDAVLRARMMLLGSGYLSLGQRIEAYQVLAEVSPLAYLPKLSDALVSQGYAAEFRDRPDMRLALHAEAVATARRVHASHPKRTQVLVGALAAYQADLYSAGRRAEGFAVCEEMAETGRWGFEQGQVPSPMYGHRRLAAVLAEEGRHREAAEICGKIVQAARPESRAGVSLWTMVEWVAELDAAGHHDAALKAFAEVVGASRGELGTGSTSLAILTWHLVHHAGMLDTAGRRTEAGGARKEALALLAELGETGERTGWSNFLSWWSILLALSGRSAEPAASPSAPAPAFGSDLHNWSPDIRQAYFRGLSTLEEEAAALAETAKTDPHEHLPELVAVHRRLTTRSALYWENRSHLILKPLRPVLDEGVALARRLADLAGADRDREALGRALTDRSMFLVAAQQYGEAYDDFLEVIALLD